MKKLLAVTLVGAVVVGGVVIASGGSRTATPEGKMCVRLGELCGEPALGAKDLDACVEDLTRARKMSGDPGFERSRACVDESKSCAAAAGCMGGGIGMGSLGELMKGFGNALSR